jgi:hypothetical protein
MKDKFSLTDGELDTLVNHFNNSPVPDLAAMERKYKLGMALKFMGSEIGKKLVVDEKLWEDLKGVIKSSRGSWDDFFQELVCAQVLFHDRLTEIQLNEEEWRGIDNFLSMFKEPQGWEIYLRTAGRIKLLFPERASQLKLTSGDLRNMRKELADLKEQGRLRRLMTASLFTKILQAEKVEISENGMDIVMPEVNLGTPAPQIPAIRKF